ncbi:hypothetical protein KLP28_16260 [Nocardioidaceae bacterium]|nr:hypothetical protein KLP28_16260 [Nocardioidaceae bacterium]
MPSAFLPLLTALTASLALAAAPATATPPSQVAASVAPSTATVAASAAVDDRTSLSRQLRRGLAAADAGRRAPARTTPQFSRLGEDGWGFPDSCGADKREVRHEICTFGDPAGERTVVLLGSSHATMWVPGLDAAAAAGGTRLVGFFKFGCSPIVRKTQVDGKAWPECAAWREWALDRIAELGPDAVVVAGHHYVNIEGRNGRLIREDTPRYDKAFAAGTRKLGRRLGAVADEVTILGDTVARVPRTRPTVCLEANDMRLKPCVQRLDKRTRAMNARDRRAVLAVGASFYDPNRLLCVKRRCPVVAAGHFVNRDFSHVTRTWSLHVGPLLARELRVVL